MHFPWAISLSPVLCVGMVCGQDKQERGLSPSGTKLGGRRNLRSQAETAANQSRAGEVWPGGREPREATQAGNHAECKAPGFPLKPVRSQGSEEVKAGTPIRGHPPFSVKRKWGPKVTWQPRACTRWDAPPSGRRKEHPGSYGTQMCRLPTSARIHECEARRQFTAGAVSGFGCP